MGVFDSVFSRFKRSATTETAPSAPGPVPDMPKVRRIPDDALNVLTAALEDPDREVRVAAAWALGRCGDDRGSEALKKRLSDPDNLARLQAAWALVRMGSEEGYVCLQQAMTDKNNFVRSQAVSLAWETDDQRFVKSLIQVLRGNLKGAWDGAICGLGHFGGTEAEKTLLDALEDDRFSFWALRTGIAEGLADMGSKRALPLLRKVYKESTDSWTRLGMAKASARLGDPDLLKAFLKEEKSSISCDAAGLLGQLGDDQGLRILLNAAGEDEDEDTREAAAKGLRHFRGAAPMERLVKLLSDAEESIRNEAAESLGVMGDKGAVAPLVRALGDRSEWVTSNVARALGQIGGPGVFEALQKAEDRGPRSWLSCGVADAMASLKDPRAMVVLERTLTHDQGHVRKSAAQAMAVLGDVRAVPLLRSKLNDPDGQVRCAVAEAIAILEAGPDRKRE